MNLLDELDGKGMQSYSYFEEAQKHGTSVKPLKVSYGDAGFRNFDVREVFIDDKPKGEYFIRIRNDNDMAIKNAGLFFASKFSKCEVGIIDPGKRLRLDFHLYVKTSDELMKEAMMKCFEEIDFATTKQIQERLMK